MPPVLTLLPQLEDLGAEFPGWTTVLAYSAIYIAAGFVVYLVARFAVGRIIRRQDRRMEAAITLAPGPARDRLVADSRDRLDRVQLAIRRVAKIGIGALVALLLVGDLFPTLDTLSGSATFLIVGGAALGIAGAIQPFVRDIIGGALIFFEDAYKVGDDVRVAGVEGKVEELHLRRTVIRASDGSVHVVPNGAVGVATNMSRVWATATAEIVLAHEVDLDRAISIADATAATLAADPAWSGRIIETPRVAGVRDVSPEGVTIVLSGRVLTGEAGAIAGELRRRLHHACREADIPLARRHDTVLGPHPAPGEPGTPGAPIPTAETAAAATGTAGAAAPTDPTAASAALDRRGTAQDPRAPSTRR